MKQLAVLIPTLGRADRLRPLIENLADTTPPIWRAIFVVDEADEATHDAVDALIAGGADAPDAARFDVQGIRHDGTYPQKINAGVRWSDEPWCLLTADDVRFHDGWWEATEEARNTENVGVIGTNDLHNPRVRRGEYATQILVARWYIDDLGTIDERGKAFHEGYHHDPVDLELCGTAKARGLYAHVHEAVIEHLHPAWGLREVDDTDRKGQRARKQDDLALYEARRPLWERLPAGRMHAAAST